MATRPVEVNGFGWSVKRAKSAIENLLDQFPLVEETPAVFPTWLNLVTEYNVRGKRAHDVRLVAVVVAAEIQQILTLNPKDFQGLSEIEVRHPREVSERP